MAYSAKVGSFNIDTSKTAGQDQAVSGVGFQPKIVFFFWGGSTASTDTVAGGDINFGFGAAVSSSSRWGISNFSEDAEAKSDSYNLRSTTEVMRGFTDGATTDGIADFKSMDADGFTLTIDDQFTQAYRVSYLALGGADLTNVFLGTQATPTSTGNYNVTGVGFQPDALITAGQMFEGTADNDLNFFLGMATGSSNQGVVSAGSLDNLATTNTFGYGYNGENIARVFSNVDLRESFVSFGVDGFTLNHLENTNARTYYYACLKGGQYSVGDVTTRTDGNDISETVGFQPTALLFASANRALSTQNAQSDHLRLSIGAGTSTSNRAVAAVSDEDNLADSETAYGNYDSAVYAHVADDAIVALMDIKSIDASGFTAVMDDTEASACWVTYLAIGAAAAGAQTIALTTASITASGQAVTVVEGAVTKALNTATVTASGQAVSLVKGTATTALDTATITASGQAVTFVLGAATVTLNTATLTASGQAISVLGITTVSLNTATLTGSGQAVTLSLGAVTKLLTTASTTASGQAVTLALGAVTISLTTATITATGQATDIGNINRIQLVTASVTANGQALAVVAGAVTKALATASITASGISSVVVPGASTKLLGTAALTASGIALDVVPGAVTKALNTGAITASGQAIDVVPGAMALALDTAALLAGGQSTVILPGAMSISLDTASIAAGGIIITVVPGGATVALDTAGMTASGQGASVSITLPDRIIQLDTATLTASGPQVWAGLLVPVALTLAARSLATSLEARDITMSLFDRDMAMALDNRSDDLTLTLFTRSAALTVEEGDR